jgi:hypothetical protein
MQGAAIREAPAKATSNMSVNLPKHCAVCRFPSYADICALCRRALFEKEKTRLFMTLADAPWTGWDKYKQCYADTRLSSDVFLSIRREILARLRDELSGWIYRFNQAAPVSQKEREKARKKALLYVTIKLARRPDFLSSDDVKGALGSWRFNAIF